MIYEDSELIKMASAIASKNKKSDGFQGCKNYGKSCNFNGFYLAKYSPEGLCSNCELKEFPDRYYGCCFCGKAIDYYNSCWSCRDGFSEWALNLFYNKNENSKYDIIRNGIYMLNTVIPKIKLPVRIAIRAKINEKWLGFYEGDNQWIIPDPFELKNNIDISDICWENKFEVLKRELEKNGLYIYEEIQIKKQIQ
jgi:hypothetical protein